MGTDPQFSLIAFDSPANLALWTGWLVRRVERLGPGLRSRLIVELMGDFAYIHLKLDKEEAAQEHAIHWRVRDGGMRSTKPS
jgi:hypothetical protein